MKAGAVTLLSIKFDSSNFELGHFPSRHTKYPLFQRFMGAIIYVAMATMAIEL